MNRRIVALAAISVLVTVGSALPAHAQGTFHDIGLGRAALAFWEDLRTESFAFALAGQGLIYNSDTEQPLVGDVGCAAVGNAKRATFGCGELAAFSIDDDLGSASAKAQFEAMTVEFATEEVTGGAKVSFDLTWTASGDLTPRGHEDAFLDFGGPVIGLGAGAEVVRDASRGVKGRVTASSIRRAASPKLVDAATMMGFGGFLELHG